MNLQDTDFDLFGLPEQFAQDRGQIDARWKALQGEVHPDRFAAEGAAAQRLAMQWSVRINEAYQRLKDPVKRAAYLCQLRGQALDPHNNTAMPAAFLVQQMQWREALDEASQMGELQALQDEVDAALDQLGDPAAAGQEIRGLMFNERIGSAIRDLMADLDDAVLGQS